MRIRLFAFGLLAFCQLQLQPSGVLGQKYYMNFAFNNNNPDGDTSDGTGGGNSANPDHITRVPQSQESPASQEGGHSEMIVPGNKSDDDKEKTGEEGDHKGDGKDYVGEKPKGIDDDDDDSDSQDAPGERDKEREHDAAARQAGDHSHHSSYEISIDDSFGGRYVRSIYESSESHGHSGSNAGSGSGDKPNRKSSKGDRSTDPKEANVEGQDNQQNTYGENDYEEAD